MAFSHEGRTTEFIRDGIGLRQGCSVSPMRFRWVLQDTLEPLHEAWTHKKFGLVMDEDTPTHLAWAHGWSGHSQSRRHVNGPELDGGEKWDSISDGRSATWPSMESPETNQQRTTQSNPHVG